MTQRIQVDDALPAVNDALEHLREVRALIGDAIGALKAAPYGAKVCDGHPVGSSTLITKDVEVGPGRIQKWVELRVNSTRVYLDNNEVSALIKALQERSAHERAYDKFPYKQI